MNATTVDIKDILEGESSLGLVFGTNLFIGKEPSTPDDTVSLYDSPGYATMCTLDQVGDYFFPSVQVIVRNTSYLAGVNLAQDIVTTLHARAGERWGGTLYTAVRCVGGPYLMDYDANNRPRFVINFDIQRRS